MAEQKLIWKSEAEQKAELEHIKETRDREKYGNDGYVECASGKFKYKSVAYLIKVLRYYTFQKGFCPLSSQRISDCHVVVEYADETKSLADLIKQFDEYSEFLWYDTLHTWNDKQTIEEQIQECHNMAKKDIEKIKGRNLTNKLDEKITNLKEMKKNILKIAKKKNKQIKETNKNGKKK